MRSSYNEQIDEIEKEMEEKIKKLQSENTDLNQQIAENNQKMDAMKEDNVLLN